MPKEPKTINVELDHGETALMMLIQFMRKAAASKAECQCCFLAYSNAAEAVETAFIATIVENHGANIGKIVSADLANHEEPLTNFDEKETRQ